MTAEEYTSLCGSDSARIAEFPGTKFLILGWNKNTKTEREAGRDAGQYFRDGEPIDFDYLHEEVVASGGTDAQLEESVREYLRIRTMSMEEYLKECAKK